MGGWWGAPCFVSFFRDVCGLVLPEKEERAARAYEKVCRSVSWFYPTKDFVMLVNRPASIKRDANGRLHNPSGPSTSFRDGWSLYHWHGVEVPKEWIVNKEALTPTIAINHPNVEKRRAACEILGWHKILDTLKAVVVDKDEDAQIGTLYEVDLLGAPKSRFLAVRCGTGRDFVLPVPSTCKTALEANAWTYGLDGITLKQLEVRT